MASDSHSILFDLQSAKRLSLIVGLVCLSGFSLGILALGLPANIVSLEWRINFLQQLGDRSITLMFGAALTMWGICGNRQLLKRLAIVCLIGGIIIHLCSILVIYDSLALRVQALANIDSQANNLQTQIDVGRNNPEFLKTNIAPTSFERASQNVASQAEALKQKAKAQITKTGIVSLGNLIVIGLGLIALGRWGLSGI
jgi:hypothetical protein